MTHPPPPDDESSAPVGLPPGLPPAAYDLGAPKAEFAVDARRLRRCSLLALLLAAGGVGVLIAGARIALSEPRSADLFARRNPTVGVLILFLVAGLAFLVSAFGYWRQVWARRGLRVFLCPGGIVWALGPAVTVIRWEEVTALRIQGFRARVGGHTRATLRDNCNSFVLQRADGPPVECGPHLPRVERLARACLEETLARLLPAVEARFDAGEEIRFGPLRVSREGVGDITRRLPWEGVRAVRAEALKGACFLTIYERGKGRLFDIPFTPGGVGEIPNLHVFWALADRVRGVGEEKPPGQREADAEGALARADSCRRWAWASFAVPTALLVVSTVLALSAARGAGWAVGLAVGACLLQALVGALATVLLLYEARRQDLKAAGGRAGPEEPMHAARQTARVIPYAALFLLLVVWPFLVVGALVWLLR